MAELRLPDARSPAASVFEVSMVLRSPRLRGLRLNARDAPA